MPELAGFHNPNRTTTVPCPGRPDRTHLWAIRNPSLDLRDPLVVQCTACGRIQSPKDVATVREQVLAAFFDLTDFRTVVTLDLSPRTLLEYITMPSTTLPDDIKKATVKIAFDMAEEELDEETPDDERHDPEKLVREMLLDVWPDYCREPYISLSVALYEDSYEEFRVRMTGGGPTAV